VRAETRYSLGLEISIRVLFFRVAVASFAMVRCVQEDLPSDRGARRQRGRGRERLNHKRTEEPAQLEVCGAYLCRPLRSLSTDDRAVYPKVVQVHVRLLSSMIVRCLLEISFST
jgi:hypothetical protein